MTREGTMTRRQILLSATRGVGATLLLATLIAGGTMAQPSVHASVNAAIVDPQFAADSGDKCLMGTTKGTLSWQFGSRSVDIKGLVVDLPLPTQPDKHCGDDQRETTAIFTAYGTKDAVLASNTQRVDNGTQAFSFRLTDTTTTRRIDRLVVEVCRSPLTDKLPVYCGARQEYRPLTITG